MNYSDLKKLKVFFFALKKSNYKPKQIPNFIEMDGSLTPIDKTRCLELLRSLPNLKGKDDNQIFEDLSNPNKVKSILGQLAKEQQVELTKALEEKPVITQTAGEQPGEQGAMAEQPVPAGTATDVSSGNLPFGMPAGTTFTPRMPRRVIHNIPHTETPQSKIIIANKSGVVAEKPPSKIYIANKGGVVTGEHPIGSQTAPLKGSGLETPKIILTDKSGNIVGERSIRPGSAPLKGPRPEERPRIIIANKSGAVAGTPPKTIFITDKGGTILREHTIKSPSRFSAFTSSAQNFISRVGSKAGIFARRNLGRVTRGLGEIAKGIGRNIAGPGLTSAYNFLGKAGNGAINAFASLSSQVSRIGTSARGLPGLSGKLGGRVALVVFLAVILLVFTSSLGITIPGTTTPTGEASPTAGTTNISSCKFTRAGNSQLIKSSILQSWISNAATTAGIPPQVLASVAMHENPDFVANTDDNHDAIKSNQNCIKGVIFCEKNGQVLHSLPNKDNPCTSDEIAAGAKTAQAVGLMQHLDIYNPGKDLCSITESLNLAANKLKNDGITAQPTQDQINAGIKKYYNSCDYDSYSYCNEVWQDVQNCQSSSAQPPQNIPIVTAGHSCVTNASYVPFPGYQNIKEGNYSYVCGHCRPIFNAIDTGVNLEGGTQVLAVVDGRTRDDTNPIGGPAIMLIGNDGQNYYYAHLAKGSLVIGEVKAGQVIASIAPATDASAKNNGVAHVHFSAGTKGNIQSRDDPANIPAGPLLDSWCGNNVCNGKPNAAYDC